MKWATLGGVMKTRMTISVLLFLSMFGSAVAQTQAPAASQSAQPTIDPQKEQLIRHLLDLMQLNQTMEKVMGPMMSQMSRTIEAGAPANEKVHKFSELVNQRLVAKMKTADLSPYYIPVYDKYYTPDDIKALIAFYESPVGQKSLEVQASLSLELMSTMGPAIQQFAKDAENEVRKDHPELAPDGA
jgi:hypothetical protein